MAVRRSGPTTIRNPLRMPRRVAVYFGFNFVEFIIPQSSNGRITRMDFRGRLEKMNGDKLLLNDNEETSNFLATNY